MILYENNIRNFNQSFNQKLMASYVFEEYYRITNSSASPLLKAQFKYMIEEIHDIFHLDEINQDCGIRLDLNISTCDTRLMVIFSSKSKADGRFKTLVVDFAGFEKVWLSNDEDFIYADYYDHGARTFIHPSYQALTYKRFLSKDDNSDMDFYPVAMLFDCSHKADNDIVEGYKEEYIKESPVFYCDEKEQLFEKYRDILYGGDGLEALKALHTRDNKIIYSEVKELFDDQKYVVNSVINDLKENRDSWYLVEGQSGTGLTVVAGRIMADAYKMDKEVNIFENDPTFTVSKLPLKGVSVCLYSDFTDSELIENVLEEAEINNIPVRQFQLNMNVGKSDGGNGLKWLAHCLQLDENHYDWNPDLFDINICSSKSGLEKKDGYANVCIHGNIGYDVENGKVTGTKTAIKKVYYLLSYGTKGVNIYPEDKNLRLYLSSRVEGAKNKYSWLNQLSGKSSISESDIVQAQSGILSNEKMQDKFSELIVKEMGIEAWNKMGEDSKLCLVSGTVAYHDMKTTNPLLDFSGACLQLCKAVEIESIDRLFTKYLEFFINKYGDEALDKAPEDLLRDQKPGRPKEFNKPGYVTIGSIKFIVGIDGNGRIVNDYNWNEFKDYAEKVLLISPEKAKETMAAHIGWIQTIKDEYRNMSAHKNCMDVVQANDCIDYIIGKEHKLGLMLDDYKF